MQEVARVYAEALFDVAKEKGKLDAIREQLGQFADAVDGNRDLQVFFFSPYFSSAEKVEGLKRAISGADAGAGQLPRAADREAPDDRRSSASAASSTSSGSRRTGAST